MKVKVRLYGTLGQRFPGYRLSQGIEVEIPDGTTTRDLLALLDIPESQRAVVIAEGRILKAGETVRSRVPLSIVQAVGGG